jgi:glycosyltransferase involved in cell wall biosynthesis
MSSRRRVLFIARRLGTGDGVAAASAVWQRAFGALGWEVATVAGSGCADHLASLLDGVGRAPREASALAPVREQLEEADLVVVENLGTVPAVADLLRGRPALLRHHDLPWQDRSASIPGGAMARATREAPLPDDPAWRHVTVNERSRLELAARGVRAETIYHMFDPDPPPGRRARTRSLLGLSDTDRLLLQPTRGAASKNVAGGLLLARAVRATYWLLGPVEPSYRPRVEELVRRSGARVLVEKPDGAQMTIEDAYAASDLVALPSSWEGFGNGAIEAALHRRPFAAGRYPVATELRRYGFSWFDCEDPAPIARFLASPDPFVLDRNELVAKVRFSAAQLPSRLEELANELTQQ